MSPDRRRLRGLGLAIAFAGGIAATAQELELPAGPGADVTRGKCLTCHGVDLIRQQRLTRNGWEREVDKMVRWGARVTDAERSAVIDYLAANWRVGQKARKGERGVRRAVRDLAQRRRARSGRSGVGSGR